ncbi:DNA sulfur modification protein DndB [Microbacterium sp. UBA3394]|uniref:DNA sulfur modification protein DndB n=1 Tax=Microbacterium sp. UBA3394 TaxID=1946945 RepID=UPI000C3911AA|nr:DNA sulfur modification protein DndB [Microbacterium sp. UBA3394]MAB77744.1 DNA sulfur modification protein DndB [Planctomycetota bacterium]MAM53482.1 DNA sulfur modification protein DndB [Microbacterium sp.]HAS32869.1 DNA sulfur modification protein DndB [Microbacterium sp.]|tara:strand:- start:17312 stop:18445 length:1134 start_codon:yes stop_codon:yes gene_type:complete
MASKNLLATDDRPAPKARPQFEYNFPAIRGIQAGRTYFITMCPLRMIPRLFLFDEEELPAEMRAQRSLNRARVPEIARYMTENPENYIFSALTASVDAEVTFESLVPEASGAGERVGTLSIPMEAKFVINDGQHRRAAIQQALAENPELGDETIAIVLFIDIGLERCQQMFADLNRYAIRPSKSISVLYDHRDEQASVTRLVVAQTPVFRDLTDFESNNLAARSRNLFTLSGLHTATVALLDGVEEEEPAQLVERASEFWTLVAEQFPQWQQVQRAEITAGGVRQDFIHTHSVILHALGIVGNTLLTDVPEDDWAGILSRLQSIDWRRNATDTWEGKAMTGGRVAKNRANVQLTSDYIAGVLGLDQTSRTRRIGAHA